MSMFEDTIQKLLHEGVEISMFLEDGKIKYNLNTGMKSHCHIYPNEDGSAIQCEMRYGMTDIAYHYTDLLFIVKDCLHGRDFLNVAWESLLIKENVLNKSVKVCTTYSYS